MQKRQERARKLEENKVYLQLHEAMEAIVHICRDGCRTIGPRDQTLKSGQAVCRFPACKGIELLLRHFSACKMRVPGGCANCKRIWQLLELHSRMCSAPETCHVPLCRWVCCTFCCVSAAFFTYSFISLYDPKHIVSISDHAISSAFLLQIFVLFFSGISRRKCSIWAERKRPSGIFWCPRCWRAKQQPVPSQKGENFHPWKHRATF